MEKFCKRLQNEKGFLIIKTRSDHVKEFENAKFEAFCNEHGIRKEFLPPKTPQQNWVVERKNRVIQEMERVMFLNKDIPQKFWGEAVNTSCHIGNRIFFLVGTKKTSYVIRNEKKPKMKCFWVFGSKCFILNDSENLGKFDAKSDEWIFLGYSVNCRAYRVYNKRIKTVMESINVVIDDAIWKRVSMKVEMVKPQEKWWWRELLSKWWCWETITKKGNYTYHIKKGN